MKIRSTIRKPQSLSYLLDPVNCLEGPSRLHGNDSSSSLSRTSKYCSSLKVRNQCNFGKNRYVENADLDKYGDIPMETSFSDDWLLYSNEESFVDRNLSEISNKEKRKERPRTYSVSDHISQMSTWQNSLITEFGMLPTLPCIPYYSVVDSSDDECMDGSCNGSAIFSHDLHMEVLDDTMSNLVISDKSSANARLAVQPFNNTELPKVVTSLPNDSEYYETIGSSYGTNLRPFDVMFSSNSSSVGSFRNTISKKGFKFKFPKIKFGLKCNQNDIAEIIAPVKQDDLRSSTARVIPSLPDSALTLKKVKKREFSLSSFKQERINLKFQGIFRKFILKNHHKKLGTFKNEGTQTCISMFDNFLHNELRQSQEPCLKNSSCQTENVDPHVDISNLGVSGATSLIQKPKSLVPKTSSLTTIRSFTENSSRSRKKVLSDQDRALKANTSEYYSSKQTICYCTCTCLCEACCTMQKPKSLRRRPSSVVFIEIAASRKNADYSDTLNFGDDFDEKIATTTSITHTSDDSLNRDQLQPNALSFKSTDNNSD